MVAAEGIPGGIPPENTERIEALSVMKLVVAELGLPDGESPPSTNFNAICKKLDIKGWSVQRVADAFRRSYPRARDEYEGRKPPPTVEQEAIRRARAGKERGWETPLEAIRQFVLWLEEQSEQVRETQSGSANYDQWQQGRNRQVKAEWGYYYPRARSIKIVLGITWSLALAVGRSEMTLDEARQREARRQDEGPLRLIALRDVAEVLGLHTDEVNRLRNIGELPPAAVANCDLRSLFGD